MKADADVGSACPQSCLGQYLVGWIAQCGAAAVRLSVKEDFATGCFFDLTVAKSSVVGVMNTTCQCGGFWVSCVLWRLQILLDPASNSLCPQPSDDTAPCPAGGPSLEQHAAYRIGSNDLLVAVRDLCRRRGLRCTDVSGTGQLILFERV